MGKPRVNYLEAITKRINFDYLHKKQTGASPRLVPANGGLSIRRGTASSLDAEMKTLSPAFRGALRGNVVTGRWPGAVWAGDRLHGADARG